LEQVLLVKLVNAGIDLGRCLFRSNLLSSGLIFWRLIVLLDFLFEFVFFFNIQDVLLNLSEVGR
jgi:hypothetical protein